MKQNDAFEERVKTARDWDAELAKLATGEPTTEPKWTVVIKTEPDGLALGSEELFEACVRAAEGGIRMLAPHIGTAAPLGRLRIEMLICDYADAVDVWVLWRADPWRLAQ